MPETRRRYDQEFRAGVVRYVVETGKPVAACARELGVNEGTLGNWVAKQRERDSATNALTETERAELVRLRRENSELRMQRDVLKRSTALWVNEAMNR